MIRGIMLLAMLIGVCAGVAQFLDRDYALDGCCFRVVFALVTAVVFALTVFVFLCVAFFCVCFVLVGDI